MSATTYWRPVPQRPDGEPLDQINWVLGPRLFGQDGSSSTAWETVDESLVDFLEGVIAGATHNDKLRDECRCLILAIKQHGEIQVCIRR